MDTLFGGIGAPFLSLMAIFFGITAVLWFLLPFSIFGIKSRLDEQIRLLRILDERLRQSQSTTVKTSTGQQELPGDPIAPAPTETETDGPPSTPEPEPQDDDRAVPQPENFAHKGRWQKPDE